MKNLIFIIVFFLFMTSVFTAQQNASAQSAAGNSGVHYENVQNSTSGENSTPVKIFMLVEISFLAVIVVLWRRRKPGRKREFKSDFKQNIVRLRQEKIDAKENPHLSMLRSKLQVNPACLNVKKDIVSDNARKMSISKGEIYLAARIKSYSMAKECSAR